MGCGCGGGGNRQVQRQVQSTAIQAPNPGAAPVAKAMAFQSGNIGRAPTGPVTNTRKQV